MSKFWYDLKIYFFKYRAYLVGSIGILALLISGIVYLNTPKIPVTEEEFNHALHTGKKLFDAHRYTEAYKVLIYPAEKGYPLAKYLMGEIYHDGKGLKANYKQAAENYFAVMNELPQAKYRLAQMVLHNQTDLVDKEKAVNLLAEAAYSGYVLAQKDMGAFSLLSKDYEQAYFWLSVLDNNDNDDIKKARDFSKARISEYQVNLLDVEIQGFIDRNKNLSINE
ncbi:MAG: hypothetical protein MJ247_03490 [Alphaproteobacteria bacterium]|nr:hypothetical protein [Alphaproteobacteria bacterium]